MMDSVLVITPATNLLQTRQNILIRKNIFYPTKYPTRTQCTHTQGREMTSIDRIGILGFWSELCMSLYAPYIGLFAILITAKEFVNG